MKNILLITLVFILGIEMTVAQKQWSLADCVTYATDHNLPIKRQDILVAIKNLDQEMARRDRLPAVGGYFNGYSTFGHSQDVFGTIRRNDNFNSNVGINAEVTLYQYNYLRNQAKKATLQAEQEELEKGILRRDLTLKVVQSYLEVLLSQALVHAQDSAINFSLQLLDKAEKSTAIGATAPAVVFEAKANLAREKQQFQQYHKEAQKAKLALAQYMNFTDYQSLIIYDPLLETEIFKTGIVKSQSDLIQTVFDNNPILAKLENQLLGLDVETKLIKATDYPLVKGSASLGTTYFNAFKSPGERPVFVQSKDNFAQQLAIAVTVPIFNKGKTKRQLQQITFRKQEIELLSDYEKLQQVQILEKLNLDWIESKQQYDISTEAFAATKESLEYSRLSFMAGKASIYDINNSKNNLIKSESDMIRARYNTLFSLLMLHYQVSGAIKFSNHIH
ncbi:TolC family protein [Sphingobacterium faecium]|uniref:TolC family protein n=1 Tax=Sphingobacterium faecium TaxID=34087 RepID=UPI0024796A4D|nr:TolC family protein [Sphingobacterium faecium]WGQ13820.1 TolC family protein [Sphingobacterium faecium]